MMVVADQFVDLVFSGGFADVVEDCGSSAIALLSRQGRKRYPRVYISESERTPGYRNRSHVPPNLSRPSSMTKLFVGHALRRWHAPPTPDNPAPTMMTSTCSTVAKYIELPKSTKGTNALVRKDFLLWSEPESTCDREVYRSDVS